MSIYRRLFREPIRCPVCGSAEYWTVDVHKCVLLCVKPKCIDDVDNDSLCMTELEPSDVWSDERDLLLFKRITQIFRLFPST